MTQLDESPRTVSDTPDEYGPGRDPDRGGPPRITVPSDQDWDGRAWTGREADRPAAISEADRTQVVPGDRAAHPPATAAGPDAEQTQWVDPDRIAPNDTPGPGQARTEPRPVRDGRTSAPTPPPTRAPGPAPGSGPPRGPAPTPTLPRRATPGAVPPLPPRRPAPPPTMAAPPAGPTSARASSAPPPGATAPPRPPGPASPPPSGPAPAAGIPPGPPPSGGWPRPWAPVDARSDDRAGPSSSEPTSPPEDADWSDTDTDLHRARTLDSDPDEPVSEDPDDVGAGPLPTPQRAAGPSSELLAPEVERGLLGAGLSRSLVEAAREAWPPIDAELLDDVAAAGESAYVRALTDPRDPVASAAPATAVARTEEATETAVAVDRLADRHEPGRADWAQGGWVIPVIGASAGIGASVVAAALFDALDVCGVPTLLVDAADPARSGLASAVANQGAAARTLHPKIGIAYARRGDGWVAQLSTPPTEVLAPRMVPSPSWWLPDETAPAATVVDLGWDPWQIAASPLRGAGRWLEAGEPMPRPVLVVEANRPSLAKANQLLARLRPWIRAGHIAAPAGLVVLAASRWPRHITGVAAQALGELMETAVFLPYDREVAVTGIGPGPVSDRLRTAAAALPARWGLIPNNLAPGGALPSLTRLFTRGR